MSVLEGIGFFLTVTVLVILRIVITIAFVMTGVWLVDLGIPSVQLGFEGTFVIGSGIILLMTVNEYFVRER